MERFLRQYEDYITGIITGFDRVLFRGTLRAINYPAGMGKFLGVQGILYKDYAGKSVNDILGDEKIKNSAKLTIQTLASSLMRNDGKGNFVLSPLPVMAQTAPVFTFIAADFDSDGKIDIFTGGNFWDIKPDIGRLDANAASFYKGDGSGSFNYISPVISGLKIKGQVRDALTVKFKNDNLLLLARNNDGIIFLQTK